MIKRYFNNKLNYFLLFIFLLGIQCFPRDMKNKIVGRWYIGNDAESYIEFTCEGRYLIYAQGLKISDMPYQIDQENDSTIIYIKQLDSLKNDIKVLPKFDGENLILVFYKSLNKELCSHIDAIGVLRKESTSLPVEYSILPGDKITKYYLNDSFTGKAYIAYNQPKGILKEFDEKGNRILRIAETGLCKTQFIENPFGYAMRKFKFFYLHDAILKEIPQITVGTIHMLMNNNHLDVDNKYHNDSIYVCIWGYNPDRGYLNEIFGERIMGNVEQFQINTLKNFFESMVFKNPY